MKIATCAPTYFPSARLKAPHPSLGLTCICKSRDCFFTWRRVRLITCSSRKLTQRRRCGAHLSEPNLSYPQLPSNAPRVGTTCFGRASRRTIVVGVGINLLRGRLNGRLGLQRPCVWATNGNLVFQGDLSGIKIDLPKHMCGCRSLFSLK